MTCSGEEVGGLLVNSFELIGDLEDLDCSVDGGADGGKGIWVKHHTGVSARKRERRVCVDDDLESDENLDRIRLETI